mmetsp:Transcript_20646/g.31036  ORF Transcript_20646/g.31036 Transcript_20646/m.31036 type:complete len:86 (+) Transcript_20646:156-413(+)
MPTPQVTSNEAGSSNDWVDADSDTEYDPDYFPYSSGKKRYVDHSTLPLPSSQIRFRGGKGANIFPGSHGQFILEEEEDNTILVKK